MKIYIYPIKSLMSHGNFITKDSNILLEEIKNRLPDNEFNVISSLEEFHKDGLLLFLIQSGGSEGIFKKDIFPFYKGPFYLLTYGSSNSLAASLEILTFLKQNGKKSEVLHGNYDYICERISFLGKEKIVSRKSRLGVIGKPSDWLISSEVDYKKCLDVFNIELIDIPQEEVIEEINKIDDKSLEASKFNYDEIEIKKALKIYEALKKIVARYNVEGFTIRCFDIISIVKSSACLALALFNKDEIIATCEGDIPAMLTAFLIKKYLGVTAFQANPQWIEPKKNEIEFAHCTLPLNMCSSYVFDTHFESGIGVGIHGELDLGNVTIVKINSELNEFYVEEGTLLENDYRKDRCRTQIKIKLDSPVTYFLTSSLGNHHQIIYGHHKNELEKYFKELGLRRVI